MDMVSAKEPGSNHNFLTDPIRLHIEDGHYLYADDTTLGADNAVGLVNMLALMEDDTVVHPPMGCSLPSARRTAWRASASWI